MKGILFLLILSTSVFAQQGFRKSIDRYWLMNDRLNTDDIMRSYKRDYFRLNIDGAGSENAKDFVDEVGDAIDSKSQAQMDAAYQKYKNTEQLVKADAGLGIWLPGWSMGEVEALPSIRVEASIGASLTAANSTVTGAELCAQLGIPTADCPTSFTSGTLFLDAYVVGTGKVGFDIDLAHENKWKSELFIYGMTRSDQIKALTAADAATTEDIDFSADGTKTTTANLDFNIGYNDGTSKFFAGVYELRLKEMKGDDENVQEQIPGARPLYVGNSPLYRLHAERKFEVLFFDLTPFAGVHYREQYKVDDGFYGGLKMLWGWKAFHFAITGMYDPEYVTVTPRVQIGILDLEVTAKTPHKEKDDFGIELAKIIAANVRLHF